jgi:hypothetical protein
LAPAAAIAEPTIEAALDEEALLEALIREEISAQAPVEAVPQGLSVAELASFTLDDVEEIEEDEDFDLVNQDDSFPELPNMPVLTPDAGKIRFAEDIVGEFRGGGRRDRKSSRRGGTAPGARGGARRGGSGGGGGR